MTRRSRRRLPPRPEDGGLILDLFAGPGGWSSGLRALGLHDIGVEWDASACATRVAEGHLTIQGDVSKVPTKPFKGRTWMLLASPPCQAFSVAGKKKGLPTAFMDALEGRYDAAYASRLRADIAVQRAAHDEWKRAWRSAADADAEHWWAAGYPNRAAEKARRPGRVLSEFGIQERERLFGPEPEVEDERGIYMAETVRWVEELHPTKVLMEHAPAGRLKSYGRSTDRDCSILAGRGPASFS